MTEFTNQAGITVVYAVIEAVKTNRDYLSEIDGAVGDGDHGINMSKGFTLAEAELTESENMSRGFMLISKILVSRIGGSMGPLYGSFFKGLSTASENSESIDKHKLFAMLHTAYRNISELTAAKIGDKTLIDVLDPAVSAYKRELDRNSSFEACLSNMLTAAAEGLEATKHMVARLGRGSRLGTRTLGHQDAGATSCYLILKALTEAVNGLINK